MHCPNCNSTAPEGSVFCINCGSKLFLDQAPPQEPYTGAYTSDSGSRVDPDKVDMYLMTNQKYFSRQNLPMIRERLLMLDDKKFSMVICADLKDPTILLIVSIFVGVLGIDRFMVGDIGLGILKLLTGGVCGIFAIIDWFLIMDRTREVNFQEIMKWI